MEPILKCLPIQTLALASRCQVTERTKANKSAERVSGCHHFTRWLISVGNSLSLEIRPATLECLADYRMIVKTLTDITLCTYIHDHRRMDHSDVFC